MMHLKYKCKVNFVKLPLIWIDLCLKLVFENATAGGNTRCRSVVNCASCSLQLPQTISHQVEYITRQLVPFTWGRVRELKNAHNSITIQNRIHVYMNFFDHKDLGNQPPAVMSTSRETPCILIMSALGNINCWYIFCICWTKNNRILQNAQYKY